MIIRSHRNVFARPRLEVSGHLSSHFACQPDFALAPHVSANLIPRTLAKLPQNSIDGSPQVGQKASFTFSAE